MQIWRKTSEYSPVKSSESDDVELLHTVQRQPNVLRRTCVAAVLIAAQFSALLAVGMLGYSFGRAQHPESHQTGHVADIPSRIADIPSLRTQTFAFNYNSTFAEHPSPETDAAWQTVFPPHGGFFHDEEIAPHGASLAVYHQLHCVDAIRHAYYTLFDAVMEGRNVTFTEVEDYSTDWHTRHCLDFLRQMLMCNADLTIEKVDPALGGIRGFGTGREHQCVVWEDVLGWSREKQRVDNKIS